MMFFHYFLSFPTYLYLLTRFFLPSTNQSPNYCEYAHTPGQMARMIAQVKQEKDYIYCNYANIRDNVKCASIPCASTATSPNCVNRPTGKPTSHQLTPNPTTLPPSCSPTSRHPTSAKPTKRKK